MGLSSRHLNSLYLSQAAAVPAGPRLVGVFVRTCHTDGTFEKLQLCLLDPVCFWNTLHRLRL